MRSNGEKVVPAKVLAEECIAVRLRLINRVVTGSRNVGRMRSKGWLETVPEENGRPHWLRVTRKGNKQ